LGHAFLNPAYRAQQFDRFVQGFRIVEGEFLASYGDCEFSEGSGTVRANSGY
jgi:hypothetical protein